jgi:hypothetical protein
LFSALLTYLWLEDENQLLNVRWIKLQVPGCFRHFRITWEALSAFSGQFRASKQFSMWVCISICDNY